MYYISSILQSCHFISDKLEVLSIISDRFTDWSIRKIESVSHAVLGDMLQMDIDWDWVTTATQALIPQLHTGITATLKGSVNDEMGKMYRIPLLTWFPLGLENRENLEKWEGIFQSGKSQGILSRLEKSGNFTQSTGKIRKNYTGKLKKILDKSGKFVSQ